MVHEPGVIAAQDVSIQSGVEVAVPQQRISKTQRLSGDHRRIDIQIESGSELPHRPSPRNEIGVKQSKPMNITGTDASRHK
jgi:hypothetical protein